METTLGKISAAHNTDEEDSPQMRALSYEDHQLTLLKNEPRI